LIILTMSNMDQEIDTPTFAQFNTKPVLISKILKQNYVIIFF